MESYRVLGEFKNATSGTGKPMAIHFDYGQVHHDKYGAANLAGNILCFGTHKVFRKPPVAGKNSSEAEEIGVSILNELYSIGVPERIIEKSVANTRQGYGDSINKIHELFARSYPGKTLGEGKIIILTVLVSHQIEEAVDITREKSEDFNCLIRLFKLALYGRLTHLEQLDVPDSLKIGVGLVILLRKEVLASKVAEGWQFVAEALLGYLLGSSKEERVEDYSIKQYLDLRSWTSLGFVFAEVDLIIYGTRISKDVRRDPDYQNIKYLSSIYAGLMNDIAGLQKEIDGGEMCNVVILLAQTMPLHDAIQEALRITESTYFEIRAAARGLLLSFPNDTNIDQIVNSTTRCAEIALLAQEIAASRYGFENLQGSKFVQIEFSEEFMKKERQIQEFRNSAHLDLKSNCEESGLAIAISKLEQDCKTNNSNSRCKTDEMKHNSILPVNKMKHFRIQKINDEEEVDKNGSDSDVEAKNELPSCKDELEIVVERTKLILNKEGDKWGGIPCGIKHLAIIPDGNRRWAKEKGIPTISGHHRGGDMLSKVIRRAFERGISTLTVWALSTENFNRSKEELEKLFTLVEQTLQKYETDALDCKVQVYHVGNRNRLPEQLLNVMEELEDKTKHFTERTLNIGLDYGGRDEILKAIAKVQSPTTIVNANMITANMWTGDRPYPEPDLIVRTGCKDSDTVRTSGFMIWQSVYSEYYFEDQYIPEVSPADVDKWIDAFGKADRRFGN